MDCSLRKKVQASEKTPDIHPKEEKNVPQAREKTGIFKKVNNNFFKTRATPFGTITHIANLVTWDSQDFSFLTLIALVCSHKGCS
jgi:hypothetical protein